jgi:hypothetical protein
MIATKKPIRTPKTRLGISAREVFNNTAYVYPASVKLAIYEPEIYGYNRDCKTNTNKKRGDDALNAQHPKIAY